MRALASAAIAIALSLCLTPLNAHADDHEAAELASASRTVMVEGGGGLPIAVTTAGNPEGPAIVFIHSFMGSTMNWEKQFNSDLTRTHRLVSLDIRGHGSSAKPMIDSAYTDTLLMAEDIKAAIDAADVERPTLVAWAYGGLFAMDYIRHFGTDDISGLVLVEANGGLEPTPPAPKTAEYRERIEKSRSADLAVIRQWTWEFGDYLMRAGPLPPEEAEIIRTSSMMSPHWVRRALRNHPTDNSDLIDRLDVPVMFLVTIEEGMGREMIDRIAGKLPNSQAALIPTGGSLSFWYETEKFNAELSRFIAENE